MAFLLAERVVDTGNPVIFLFGQPDNGEYA